MVCFKCMSKADEIKELKKKLNEFDNCYLEKNNQQLRENLKGEKLLSEKRRTDGIEMLKEIHSLKEKLEKIKKSTLHAGCTIRLPDCVMCKVQEILKDKDES